MLFRSSDTGPDKVISSDDHRIDQIEDTNNIIDYEIPIVDCETTRWSEWSTCKTCKNGLRKRSRRILVCVT